jgi:hypothetical protein
VALGLAERFVWQAVGVYEGPLAERTSVGYVLADAVIPVLGLVAVVDGTQMAPRRLAGELLVVLDVLPGTDRADGVNGLSDEAADLLPRRCRLRRDPAGYGGVPVARLPTVKVPR